MTAQQQPKCFWQTASFNQIGDSTIVASGRCTPIDDNFDPFKRGSILTNTGTYFDKCADVAFLNEYWCDGSVGKLTYGFCSAGCKVGPQGDIEDGGEVIINSETDSTTDPIDACKKKIYTCNPYRNQY